MIGYLGKTVIFYLEPEKLKEGLRKRYGSKLKGVMLFVSYASFDIKYKTNKHALIVSARDMTRAERRKYEQK